MATSLLSLSPHDRALRSLQGLSVGDGFGSRVLQFPGTIHARRLPVAPWRWSDDTHMALSVIEVLAATGSIDQDLLAAAFGRRYREDPRRGYGQGARRLLDKIDAAPWRELARSLFQGGSYGNGAAMRAGPIGAWFAGDVAEAAEQGRRQAEITHAHAEGQAGAIAVAVAAACLAGDPRLRGNALIGRVLEQVPRGETASGIRASLAIDAGEVDRAVEKLGAGQQISAQDTVPFCLWCAAHHEHDFEEALWTTIGGEQDGDTTCAIVGSLVALRSPPPPSWVQAREPLPAGFELDGP